MNESEEEYRRQIQEALDCTNPHKTPNEEFQYQKFDASIEQLEQLHDLIKNKSGEGDIHKYLDRNKLVFAFALYAFQTGHHGIYVFSKQQIVPKIQGVSKGLIPDFIVGGHNSDGIQWWVIELKGANEKIFIEDESNDVRFSSVANSAVFQLLQYIDTCSEIQSQLRDTFKMTNFREPNGLILMGTEDEFENHEKKRKMKAAWNRIHPKKLEIRTYDWLIRNFNQNINFFGRNDKK